MSQSFSQLNNLYQFQLRENQPHIIIIGAGFTGLTAAYDLTKKGFQVTLIEKEKEIGGLASSFTLSNGKKLEKFYHHWFTNDQYVMNLIQELEIEDKVIYRPTQTGIYYANNFFKLSSPLDLLNFKPLNLFNRIRLGLFTLWVRRIKNWQKLEAVTAKKWLLKYCGKQIYKIVWQPLLEGKFGEFAEEISAVWFWNKVKLRGSSRSQKGQEMLAYYQGGFAALAEKIATKIIYQKGKIILNTPVQSLIVENNQVIGIQTKDGILQGDAIIATPALPIIADLVKPHVIDEYYHKLQKIHYLANICLVLQLDRSLSQTYWLNVNDPHFPFVGVIEHTNFEPTETYGGRHIIYLSKYLPKTAELYQMSNKAILNYAIPYLQRMFPEFSVDWILDYHCWRAQYSQPIVTRNYSQLIPSIESPLKGLYIATMAQIYPEDRGTNYAIREGQKVAKKIYKAFEQKE